MTTVNLGRYFNAVCSKLGVQGLGPREELDILDGILNGGQDRALLRVLRDETALIVVKVRLLNESRKLALENQTDGWEDVLNTPDTPEGENDEN